MKSVIIKDQRSKDKRSPLELSGLVGHNKSNNPKVYKDFGDIERR